LFSGIQAVHALLHVAGQAHAFNRATNQLKAASGQPGRALYRQPNGPFVNLVVITHDHVATKKKDALAESCDADRLVRP
jgi:hypothetical protein